MNLLSFLLNYIMPLNYFLSWVLTTYYFGLCPRRFSPGWRQQYADCRVSGYSLTFDTVIIVMDMFEGSG